MSFLIYSLDLHKSSILTFTGAYIGKLTTLLILCIRWTEVREAINALADKEPQNVLLNFFQEAQLEI